MNKNMFTGDQIARLVTEAQKHAASNDPNLAPVDRAPSRGSKRHRREGKHTRVSRTNDGRRFTWHETKEMPEDTKARNRKRKKAAKKQKQRVRKR